MGRGISGRGGGGGEGSVEVEGLLHIGGYFPPD